jgi:hypothetical protein
MSLLHLARHALSMPPKAALTRIGRYLGRTVGRRLVGRMLRRHCTFTPYAQVNGLLARRFAAVAPEILSANGTGLDALAGETILHRFDLLGSGPVRVYPGMRAKGFGQWHYQADKPADDKWREALARQATPGNRAHVRALAAMIATPGYQPIDWHLDFKSGYRWSPATFGPSVAYGHKPGVDVKVPWELARLQHLPPLALAYGLDGRERLTHEFCDQVLDFLAANPPGWGVNWACAMDVAIRAANILVARDLFLAFGASFPRVFEEELAASMLAHARHIAAYLEWNQDHRGNHYLADICGLAWIAAYLPSTDETDIYLAFAIRQLQVEILRQFTPDGANFEASTAYHRLSAEMAVYTVALIQGLPDDRRQALAAYDHRRWRRVPALTPGPIAWPPFGGEHLARLEGAARFAADVTKPSGRMVQVGDNDSGRFLCLTPGVDGLDAGHLLAAAAGLVEHGLPVPAQAAAETELVRQLCGGPVASCFRPAPCAVRAAERPDLPIRIEIAPSDPSALDGLAFVAYPDFGLFVWKNGRTFLSVRCGPIGQNGNGGHAHNDQLAVELEIDGIGWAVDPGTFVYTPDLAARDRYRSVRAHFAPRVGEAEPARMVAPFALADTARAEVLHIGADGFLGRHHGYGQPVWRRVTVQDGCVVVEDSAGFLAPGAYRMRSPADLAGLWGLDIAFSAGYGLADDAQKRGGQS